MMIAPKFILEFILHAHNLSQETLRNALTEFAEEISIAEQLPEPAGEGRDFKVCMRTEEPTAIFDICGQFGRIRSVRVDQEV